ncbi:hypothetical protein CDL12_01253 [Handroanthus impetiginosus]|uniref:Homeobox domain-containing protein n=1 Tax=Handroanthus impetiginosus TaxID=429701 RepID=A0A2G9I890_9LAMI|nr:hypothetical protein CDL12_01253 [Handroanthus impetiginosus]
MWMMQSNNDHGKELKMSADRKLRPLMPRPIISSCNSNSSPFSTMSTSCCCCIHNPNIIPWNHPPSGLSDYGAKREIQTVPLVSTRWNPTPEQLQALEEMYRRGTRTPSAEQIQQIAAKLRRFGKIEGKNVFYWFQNHKARERQKKRRQLELLESNQKGLSRRYFEIENNKKLATASSCSTPSEDSVSMRGAVIAERKQDGWTRSHQRELQQINKNETSSCSQLDLSSCLPSYHSIHTINAHKSSNQENAKPSPALNLSIFCSPKNYEGGIKEDQTTLQLFPTGTTDLGTQLNEEEIHAKFTPNEFIEFLPTKN